jgi:two-component system CheB/CheR fusion protein
MTPSLAATARDVVARILETGRAVENVEFSGETPARPGVVRTWNESWYPMYDSGGEIVGFGVAAEEITERKAAEAALREADRHRNQFLAMLAHELRNPLAPIRHALEVLGAERADDATQRDMRGLIDRQLAHLTRLVDDLLDAARVTQGKIALRRQDVDLVDVVDHAVEMCRERFAERGNRVALTLPPRGELFVRGDATRLTQVVSNLLENAAKYSREGGPVALRAAADGEEAVLSVTDEGVGIPPELLPRIFDLFRQADRSLERAQGGLGIGLALVRSLVELHGGRIEVTSRVGAGSTFTVRLARCPAPAPRAARARVQSPASARRVLVVDDNADAARTLALLLRMHGHEVRECHDGLTALAVAEEFAPQVCVLDLGLPALDGFELARRLRALPQARAALMIALSGYAPAQAGPQDESFDHRLTKPARAEDLFALLAGR